ncbi:hypothetical protein, partial [Myxococcus xanthus]|uniref:hypothetical protein n=1 Tax=Myxococcus xanthus TaxID=34 RepID=UPI001C105CF1
FGFQRPSRLSCRRLLATTLFVAASPSSSARQGVSFYFSSASSVKLLFSPSCWLPESSAPPSGFR